MSNVYLTQKRGILISRLRHACGLAFYEKSKPDARKLIEQAAQEVLHEANYVFMRGNCLPSELREFKAFWINERAAALKAWA